MDLQVAHTQPVDLGLVMMCFFFFFSFFLFLAFLATNPRGCKTSLLPRVLCCGQSGCPSVRFGFLICVHSFVRT